jgi:hypothetical protein
VVLRTYLALGRHQVGHGRRRAKAYRLLARILGAAVEARYRALVLVASWWSAALAHPTRPLALLGITSL